MVKDVGKHDDIGVLSIVGFENVAFAERDDVRHSGLASQPKGLRNRFLPLENDGVEAVVSAAEGGPNPAMRAGDIQAEPGALGDGKVLHDEALEVPGALGHGALIEIPVLRAQGPVDLHAPPGPQHVVKRANPVPLRRSKGHEISERIQSGGPEVLSAEAGQRPRVAFPADISHRHQEAQHQIKAGRVQAQAPRDVCRGRGPLGEKAKHRRALRGDQRPRLQGCDQHIQHRIGNESEPGRKTLLQTAGDRAISHEGTVSLFPAALSSLRLDCAHPLVTHLIASLTIPSPRRGLIYLILVYCVAQVALGLWIGRKVRTSGDFFVAGRSLSPGLLFATLLAANVGAGSTIGASGLGYRDGLSAWWWVGSAGVGSFFLAQFVGPRIWKIASDHNLKTVGDFLEWRYSRDVRGVVSGLLWLGAISILSGQLIAMANILNVVAGFDKSTGAIIGGVVATIYFSAGGLLTSAYVNVVQLTVKILGFVLAVPLLVSRVGGLAGLHASAAIPEASWNFFSNGPSGFQYLALLGPAFVISPGLVQKVYGARDARAVRWGGTANSLALFVFAFLPPIIGLCARALHPHLANHELALPTVLVSDLPPFLGALGLAAVVSAELSTADAVLFILATSLSQDLYKTFINPAASDRQILRVARGAALIGGALGVFVAIKASTVVGVLTLFYSLLAVSLFFPVLFGLFIPRAGRTEAYAAIIAGVAALLLSRQLTGGVGYLGLAPPTIGLLVSGLAAGLALLITSSLSPQETPR